MRWNNLSIAEEARTALPGYRDGAVVRHFEAPGSISTRFYEVRSKSILNRVPAASRMPFRWTINPYRGCTHACAYCLSGDTKVLMADGGTREIRALQPDDLIVGTEQHGRERRYVTTEVLDRWSSIKPAFVIELEDGTELVASAEHRFLTEQGWRHVTDGEPDEQSRPHLEPGVRILGPGGHAEPPIRDTDYRRGYLCGMLRDLGSPWPDQPGRPRRAFEDALEVDLAERAAGARTRGYLRQCGVTPLDRVLIGASGATPGVDDESVQELIRWPMMPTVSWTTGFLAGVFDAGGSCRDGELRIAIRTGEMGDRTLDAVWQLGFDCAVERDGGDVRVIWIRGGVSERLRFLHTTDPAGTTPGAIQRTPLSTEWGNRVVAIRPLGIVMRMYDITTGTGDFIANGVVSHNCFARPTHTYLGFDAGRDFEREIVVKVNAPEVLRVELARPSWKGEHVALGTNTDPYQWAEGRYKLMPGIWEALRDAGNECSVLTKSPLLLRDLDLMRQINERVGFSAALSVPTLDEKAWRATEPHTPNPRARLEAVAELTRAGIRTGILIGPMMPGINDAPEQIEEILRLADEAGAAYVTGIPLHLRGEVRKVFFDWLRTSRPELLPRYERIYRRGAYAPADERQRLLQLLHLPDANPPRTAREDFDWMQHASSVDPAREPTPSGGWRFQRGTERSPWPTAEPHDQAKRDEEGRQTGEPDPAALQQSLF